VPVEADGSAFFRAPARKPLYFQLVDRQGRAIQAMRTTVYFQPGEKGGCIGCHEPQQQTPPVRMPLALRRAPSAIQPGPPGSKPFNFVQLIQPILDRRCVRCHDGSDQKIPIILTRQSEGHFSKAYHQLRPYLAFFEWGGASIDQIVTRPGRLGADMSRLSAVLDDPVHRQQVRLSDQERRTLYLWLDANVPFYGTYDRQLQAAQRRGENIPLPDLQ
jgi:hypothetical protein